MKLLKTSLLLALMLSLNPTSAESLSVVPYPKEVSLKQDQEKPFQLADGFTIAASKEFAEAADLFCYDVKRLYDISGKVAEGKATIGIKKVEGLGKEEYKVVVKPEGVRILASNYKSAVMGVTTLLQMVDAKDFTVPCAAIKDSPRFPYRGYMMDLGRQWIEPETIRHQIELCRWYKLPYLHLHLGDDQMWVIESKAFPELTAGKDKVITRKELKDLVEYARVRGVDIVPELDLPGHSSGLRSALPDVFGTDGGVVDMASPKTIAALKVLIKEFMDLFYTSSYFHIGGDEVWLGGFEQQEHVKKLIAENKDKYDNAHDIFLDFICQMHEFIKSNGKETLIWEGFGGTGSAKVDLPRDMIVMVWEALYNPPAQLVSNGFRIINTAWKPCYTTPGHRWTPEFIYNWSPLRWQRWNFDGQPGITPVTIETDKNLEGIQMCAWEGIDHEQILTSHERVAALSEHMWNDTEKKPWENYEPRAKNVDDKFMIHIFPATEERSGFCDADVHGVDHNMINHFRQEAVTFFKPNKATDTIRYTTDGNMPTMESKEMTEPLELKDNTLVKYGMFDAKGKMKAYKTINYCFRPIEFVNTGYIPPSDRRVTNARAERAFYDSMVVTLTNHIPDRTTLRYDFGRLPNLESKEVTGPITITEHCDFWAACLDENGHVVGTPYNAHYNKLERPE